MALVEYRTAGSPLVTGLGLRGHRAALVALDVAVMVVAVLAAYTARFGLASVSIGGLWYGLILGAVVVAWLALIAVQGGYDPRVLGVGAEEYRRVTRASLTLVAVVATASFLLKVDLARAFVAIALPLGWLLLLAGRLAQRRWLVAQRVRGRLTHRVLVVGDDDSAAAFVERLAEEPAAGFVVVGTCSPSDAARLARTLGADVVAVTASESVTPQRLRRLAWDLEGGDVDLVVAPAMTDVAGPRVMVRPVAGLPLLYVDEPRFTGAARVVKGTLDRVLAAAGLVLLAPLLAVVAVAIRLTSSGPVFFRQQRIGQDWAPFTVWKFRTMSAGAEDAWDALRAANEADGLLFKIKDDPRVTPLGRLLRRTSIDELPQLVNVLRGEMSLVGPRPLAVDPDAFVGVARRRHLVKPGMTGLWQVSGRAEQSWDEAVRLDLYYVENWSLSLDVVILLRTVLVALRGH